MYAALQTTLQSYEESETVSPRFLLLSVFCFQWQLFYILFAPFKSKFLPFSEGRQTNFDGLAAP